MPVAEFGLSGMSGLGVSSASGFRFPVSGVELVALASGALACAGFGATLDALASAAAFGAWMLWAWDPRAVLADSLCPWQHDSVALLALSNLTDLTVSAVF